MPDPSLLSAASGPASSRAAEATGPWLGILGPLVATAGGHRAELGGRKQRELLALLIIHVNQIVPTGSIMEALWGGQPPPGAEVTLRTHVSHLRRRLAAIGVGDALVTRPPGYGLSLDPERIDAYRFERRVGLGQEALGLGEPERAAHLLREALSEWRAPVLDDLQQPSFAEAETARLDELRLVALEGRIDADLALGRHHQVVSELNELVAAHPFRERFCGQLMVALYRSGRQVDALGVYSSARERLADELGLDPGPALAELETAILRHDPALMLRAERSAPHAATASRRSPVKPPADALFTVVRRVRMAGRSAEIDRLFALWDAVRKGGRRVVLVSGEAGVGKTRLVAEFAHHAAEEDTVLLVGRCDHASVIPYQPVAAALRASPEVQDLLGTAPEVMRRRLAPLLEGPLGPRSGRSSAPDELADERLALFEAVEWLVGQLANLAPIALVLEESERIDRASSLLVRHLVNTLPERVLVVVCFRDPPGSRHPPLLELLGDVEGGGLADRLALRPLTERDLASLVAELTGAAVPAGFVHRLWRNTGGNPFFATEVVRDMEARGEVASGETWPVPAGVRDVLRHRLRGLPERVHHVICCAAVLGREVEYGLLARLVDEREDLLIDSLDGAVGAGFLVEAGSSWKVSYAFPHDLMRDAVYAEIPVPRRRRLHLRAAEALRSPGPNRTGDVAAAAVHLREAGSAADPVQTAEVSLLAADEAARVYAWDEAVVHAEAAVEILDHVGAPAGRRADAAVRAAMLRLKSGIGHRRAVQHLEAALERYRAAGDDPAVASVHSRLGGALCTHHSVMDIPRAIEHFAAAERLLGDRKAAFHLHRGLSQAAMYGIRTGLLGASSQRAHELAGDLGRRDLAVLASWGRAWFRFNRGELAEAAAILEAMWETAHELGDPYLGWASVNAAALCATEYLLDPVRGRVWCRRGLTQARFDTFVYPHDAVLDQFVLALAYLGELGAAWHAADPLPADAVSRRLLLFLDSEWERAELAWAAALAADEAAGDLHDAALNARWLAGVRLLLGDEEQAIDGLRRALNMSTGGPQIPTALMVRAELARVLAVRGDVDEAGRQLARCDEIVSEGQDWRGQVGAIELARGAVAAAQGRRAASDAAYQEALEVFTAFSLPWRRAAALHEWARSLLAEGRADEAVAKHRASWRVYDSIGAAPRWRRPLAAP